METNNISPIRIFFYGRLVVMADANSMNEEL